MKGKRVIAGILLVGILLGILTGCKNTDGSKKETQINERIQVERT